MPNAIADLLDYHLRAGYCPGALVHVERAGQVLAQLAVGQVRPDSPAPMHPGVRFRLASLTKPVVTVAALMLADDGLLDLDTPIGQLLPELAGMRLADGRAPQRPPTVRDLMRHTAGLGYPQEIVHAATRAAWAEARFTPALTGLDSHAFLARLAQLPLCDEPGTAFRYGYATDVLGCLVARLAGASLGQVLRQRLFEPLGMHQTSFDIAADTPADLLASAHAADRAWHASVAPIGTATAPPRLNDRTAAAPLESGAPAAPPLQSGGGGLVSTVGDYAAFARLLASGGVLGAGTQARRLVSQRHWDELARNQLPDGVDGPAGYCGPGFGFGLGLAVRHAWGSAAMPCHAGELCWSGISGTALFVHPASQWFALLFSANMTSRMAARLAFRRALAAT